MRTKLRFILLLNQGQCRRPLQNLQRNEHCGWFRSINPHNEEKRLKLRWIVYFAKVQKPYCGTYSRWRSANQRGGTRFRSRFEYIRDSAITPRNACCSIASKTLRRPKKGRQLYAKRTTSYLLLFHGYPPVLEAIRRQHRHCRICQQFLLQNEATNLHQKTGAGHCQKPQTKIKRGMTIEIRTTVCEIFLNSLEDFTDNGSACTRTRFSGPKFGTSHESGIKIKEAQYLYSVPKRPKLRHMLENQNDKGSLQKTHWRSSTLSRKVCWLDDGRSQGPQWGRWISKQSSICCRGTRFGNSTESIPSVQNKKFSGDKKSLRKFLEPSQKPKVIKTDNFVGIYQILWRFIMESSNINTAPIRDECFCWKSGTQKKRIFSSIVAIWMEKWWADSMECYCDLRNALDLLADGKTPYERRFEEPLKGPIIPFGAMVEYHPISMWDLSRLHQFGKKVLPGIFLGSELIAEGFSKGDFLIVDLEDLEKLDASEIHLRRINAKEVQKENEFREEIDKSSTDFPDKIMYGQKYGLTLVKPSESTETRMEKRGAKTRPCSKTDRNSLYWSLWSRLQRNSLCKKMRGENW